MSACSHLGLRSQIRARIHTLALILLRVSEIGNTIMRVCCAAAMPKIHERRLVYGIQPIPTFQATSVCLLPGNRLVTLLRWIVRAMDPAWLAATYVTPVDVSRAEFGTLSLPNLVSLPSDGCDSLLGYMQHVDPVSAQLTLVPLMGCGYKALLPTGVGVLELHLGNHMRTMMTRGGLPVPERGLYAVADYRHAVMKLSAVTGYTGRPHDSFLMSPSRVHWYENHQLEADLKRHNNDNDVGSEDLKAAIRAELADRARPDYFHLVPMFKRLVDPAVWPQRVGEVLFIASPQLGLESELVELLLLESLVDEAAAEDATSSSSSLSLTSTSSSDRDRPAQLLIAHIENECGAMIAEVIERQRRRCEWMRQAQADQMRIHAEAVERAARRGKLTAANSGSDTASSLATASLFSSALAAPTCAASASSSSSASASSLIPLPASDPPVGASAVRTLSSACVLSAESVSPSAPVLSAAAAVPSPPAASWTCSKSLLSLSSLCSVGRVKYATITAAALRFLHTLRPVSVNRKGGSHPVFHFASGPPVTLVRPHGGDRTISAHAVTRLYQTMHEAAMQQMEGTLTATARATITDAE